jgi:outer membrane scaffolding protein for murein synthesis (MipA/OmpV family)
MSVPLLMVVASGAQADDDTASDSLTVGLGGQYAPRYSGSDKQVWQVVPVLQGRKGAFFIDAQKGWDMTCKTTAAGISNTRWATTSEGLIKILAGARAQTT